MQAVSNDASLRLTLSQAPPQNIELILPNVDDPARVLTARDLTRIGACLRRLVQRHGVRTYLWIGEAADLPRKVAEATRLVRARPVEVKVAVLLLSKEGSRTAFMFSNLLADKHNLVEFKKLAAGFPSLRNPAKGGEAISGFVDAFERFFDGGGAEATAVLPVPAEKFLREREAEAPPQAPAEPASNETGGKDSRLPNVGTPGQDKPRVPSSRQSEQAEQAKPLGVPVVLRELPPESPAAATPPPPRFKLDRAGKLLVLSIGLIFLPVIWSIVARLWNRIKQSRRKFPERTFLGRPSEPLLNAANNPKPTPRGPRMHPIEQRVRVKPRLPFKPR